MLKGFPCGSAVKIPPAMQKMQVQSLGRDDPLGGNGNPLQYSCLENPVDRGAWWAAVHRVAQSWTRLKLLRMHACIGEGNGSPLQYSCLENPRDRGAWWAAVYGVTQSRTRLKQRSSSSSQKKVVEMAYNPCFGVTLSQNRKRALGYIFRGFWVL